MMFFFFVFFHKSQRELCKIRPHIKCVYLLNKKNRKQKIIIIIIMLEHKYIFAKTTPYDSNEPI